MVLQVWDKNLGQRKKRRSAGELTTSNSRQVRFKVPIPWARVIIFLFLLNNKVQCLETAEGLRLEKWDVHTPYNPTQTTHAIPNEGNLKGKLFESGHHLSEKFFRRTFYELFSNFAIWQLFLKNLIYFTFFYR